MDRNFIKENGILEQYLLGELSDKEEIELNLILQKDLELQEELRLLENDFERLAFENTITPPSHIKKSLMNAVDPIVATPKSNPQEKLIPLQPKKTFSPLLAVAAGFALLFMLSSAWLYSRLLNAQYSLETLQGQTSELYNQLKDIQDNYNETNKWYQNINTPSTLKLVLKGNDVSPNSIAVSYVNHNNKTVLLNTSGLPKLESDKDYQMWADVEGVMINMGVIPENEQMVELKYIDHAESLNITIEPAGGNDHPTVERLISNVIL